MTQAPIEPEFLLLVRCCQWNFTAAGQEPLPEIPADLDWGRVVTLARRHRVQALAWHALAQQAGKLPGEAQQALSGDARTIAAANLGIAAECADLRQSFEQSEVPLLFVKGLSVGALAYRSPLLKMGWDIDLLIGPSDLPAAARILSERGYRLQLPSSPTHLQSWHARSKESVWSRDDGLHIELHTRLADNPWLISAINVHSARQLVEIAPDVTLPTLTQEELFAYLAVHGASSAWFRLKWIGDFAGLIHGRAGEDIERLFRRSQELGAGRAAGQALLLADRLFGSLRFAPTLKVQLASDRSTRLLSRAALRMMTAGTGEPTERPLGTFAIHWSQFLLQPGLAYKLAELRSQADSLLRRVMH